MATQHRFCVRRTRRTGLQGQGFQRIRLSAQVRDLCCDVSCSFRACSNLLVLARDGIRSWCCCQLLSTCQLTETFAVNLCTDLSRLILVAEQECHLTTNQAVDPHHLDQNPGYAIKANGSSCDQSSALSLQQCQEAKLILDRYATEVQQVNDQNLPAGCYRQKEVGYRFQHEKSLYKWYFNSATTDVQSDSKSEPVCKGKAKRCCCLRVQS